MSKITGGKISNCSNFEFWPMLVLCERLLWLLRCVIVGAFNGHLKQIYNFIRIHKPIERYSEQHFEMSLRKRKTFYFVQVRKDVGTDAGNYNSILLNKLLQIPPPFFFNVQLKSAGHLKDLFLLKIDSKMIILLCSRKLLLYIKKRTCAFTDNDDFGNMPENTIFCFNNSFNSNSPKTILKSKFSFWHISKSIINRETHEICTFTYILKQKIEKHFWFLLERACFFYKDILFSRKVSMTK